MKKHFIKAIILSIMTIGITAQSSSAQSTSVKEATSAVETLRLAMISADGDVLNKLCADSLSYCHSDGHLQTKAEFVSSLTSGNSDFVTIELTNQTIQIFGSTAIVRHILSASTNDKGKGPAIVKLSVLLVWVKTKGHLELVARQAVKVH